MAPDRKTRLLAVDPESPQAHLIREAAEVLRRGGLVAFPTETVYGLGANALSEEAVARIFQAKGRPSDNPLIVHVPDAAAARALAREWPPLAERAAAAFWPGPLTIVVPAVEELPSLVTAGLPTVGLRVPAHPVAHALLVEAGLPVAAPSANRSGRPSPTRAEHVYEDLRGRVDVILDAGPVNIGVESTVLDVCTDPPVILRPGGLSREDLESVLGPVELDEGLSSETPRSPGMKYRHYAPSCPALVVEGEPGARAAQLAELARRHLEAGRAVGVIVTAEAAEALRALADPLPAPTGNIPARSQDEGAGAGPQQGSAGARGILLLRVTGPRERPDHYAAALFGFLRELEAAGADIILMEGIEPAGIGLAVQNRIRKAAGYRIIRAGKGAESTFI